MEPVQYHPATVFGVDASGGEPPRSFISPQRYVQGPGVIHRLGEFVELAGSKRVGLLASPRTRAGRGADAAVALAQVGIESHFADFAGECSPEAIDEHTAALSEFAVDAVVAMGGGKTVDTGKAVAHRLGVPAIVVPTLASNDAPCSALSVLYELSGEMHGVEFYPDGPALVLVDTEIIAAAPERFLVSGFGDALATWYEADVVKANSAGRSVLGGRPTIAATAIAESCARALFEHGEQAAAAVREGRVDDHLEEAVEANTLLSGLGFESGGLALAHGVASSCTVLEAVHQNHLHGEMVAIGLLVHLVTENNMAEATRVAEFFVAVGLPVTLGQLSVDVTDTESLQAVAAATVEFPTTANMPYAITQDMVLASMHAADKVGRDAIASHGDAAYRRLHANGG